MRFIFALFLICTSLRADEADLTPLFQRAALWEITPGAFSSDPIFNGFTWSSDAKDLARSGPGYRVAGMPSAETSVRFENGKLSRITFSLYNRGDQGDLTSPDFGKRIDFAIAALTKQCGAQPVPSEGDPSAAVRTQGRTWNTPQARWLLEWSFTRELKTRDIPFRAEFIRLEISPPEVAKGILEAAAAQKTAQSVKAPTHLPQKNVEGDVWLDAVPMVDQGEKGYCVVATVERVLRYNGKDADQHELAQVANTATTGGTNVDNMVDALKKLTARLKLRVRPHFDWDTRSFLRLVDDYNRKAKREKLALIEVREGVSVTDIYRTMKPELLKEIRLDEKADFTKFRNGISRSIDEGVPLLWSVQLGIFPEREIPDAFGGHMRLIVGYNARTGELLYSDSWGPGHEKKRFPLDNAWAITTALFTVEAF